MITFKTNVGEFSVILDFEKAPVTAKNFLAYATKDFYTGTIFHRVINDFMVQGGGMDQDMIAKDGDEPIENEADNGLKNALGTVAMARTGDPHSASSQFFINVADNNFLNHTSKTMQGWGYAVFGKVISGQEVIDEIAKVKTTFVSGHQDVPVEDVYMISVEKK